MCQAEPRWHVHGRRGSRARLAALAGALALSLFVLGAGCNGSPNGPVAAPGASPDAGALRGERPSPSLAGDASVSPPPLPRLGLIPAPRSLQACGGVLRIADTEIVVDDDPAARAIGHRLAEWLGLGKTLVRVIAPGQPGPAHAIVLRLDAPASSHRDPSIEPPAGAGDESFTVDITASSALVRAPHPAGLFYAAQTLAQLAFSRPLLPSASAPSPALASAPSPALSLPCLHLEDGPTYRFRAMHLDVARHFFSKELVERYVDMLAFYKYNVFHLHLTDDQGFRLAIRSHPELTTSGPSFTQDDARELVAFAKARFITIIPEIEMPGHARAILASHPELSCTGKKQEIPTTWGVFEDVLCAGNEATYALLGDILRETTDVFPSRIIHIGGDEVPKTRWSTCPKCLARMARERLTAEQLQGAFTKRASAMLAARGRRAMAWDDALEGGLEKRDVVVAWQGAERGRAAAIAGHDVVMAPNGTTYFNTWQSKTRTERGHPGQEGYLPWTQVLAFDPLPSGLDATQAAHVLGGEGALWTEYVKTSDDLDSLLLPRLAALSEALWRAEPRAGQDPASFAERFVVQRRMLDASGVRYFVEPPVGLRPRKIFLESASLELARPAAHPDGVVRFTLDGTEPVATSAIFTEPIVLRATTTVAARLFLPGGRSSDVARGTLERVTLRPPIQPSMHPSMLRTGVLYKYFEGDFHGLPDFSRLGAAKRAGRLEALSFDATFRLERFAVLYDAWMRAPADGVYRFVANADDGVAVDVDGVRVVEDDGEHAARDADGEIALERGPHTVRIRYFQGGRGKALALSCEGPSSALGPCVLVSP